MTFTANAEVGKVCIVFSWNDVEVSICYYMHKSNPTTADFQALADQAASSVDLFVTAGVPSALIANRVVVYDMASATAPLYVSTNGLPVAGGAATDSVPNNVAEVITFRAFIRGKSGRGRVYLPTLNETNVTDGLITSSHAASSLANFLAYILEVETFTGWTHVLYQQYSGGAKLANGVTRTVQTYTNTLVARSQRRRTKLA